MRKASHEFQVFSKPAGSLCNLGCHYCYYVKKEALKPGGGSLGMADDLLEEYIRQHIAASPGAEICFSWHGGEPTILGLDYFRKITALQRKHRPPHGRIVNGMQTNGTLLDEYWCRFLAAEGFQVGVSLDGPPEMHDRYRVFKDRNPTHELALRGYRLLGEYGVPRQILCVVHAGNAERPAEVYRFFKNLKACHVEFLPLVEPRPEGEGGVSDRTMSPESWGHFLCTIFDEWLGEDVERIHVRIFDEVARTALGQEHELCIFRPTCGDVPVVEHNGDFFPCDHFVGPQHRLGNILETPLVELLESPGQRAFGQAKWDRLPRSCRDCRVRDFCHGGCPKDRFGQTPEGEAGRNYLCAGYKSFFLHCRPFAAQLAALGRRSAGRPTPRAVTAPASAKTGRNDPCPCGSGRKYKKCCLGK